MEKPTASFGPPAGDDGTGTDGADAPGSSRPRFRSWSPLGWRRRIALAAGVTVVGGLVALPFALPGSGNPGKGRSVLVFTSTPSTTAPNQQQGAAADTATTTTLAPAPPTSTTPTTRPAAPTTTALVCHDSYNPACGAFRWSPAPAPASPTSVDVTYSPSNPTPGQEVTFTVRYSDPNAAVVTSCPNMVEYGDPSQSMGCSVDTSCPQTRYGPWNPPAKNPSSGVVPYKHTYASAGSYTFTVKYPAGTDCYDPYSAVLTGTVTVVVGPASP